METGTKVAIGVGGLALVLFAFLYSKEQMAIAAANNAAGAATQGAYAQYASSVPYSTYAPASVDTSGSTTTSSTVAGTDALSSVLTLLASQQSTQNTQAQTNAQSSNLQVLSSAFNNLVNADVTQNANRDSGPSRINANLTSHGPQGTQTIEGGVTGWNAPIHVVAAVPATQPAPPVQAGK